LQTGKTEERVLIFPVFPAGLWGGQHRGPSAEHVSFPMMPELLSAHELWSLPRQYQWQGKLF